MQKLVAIDLPGGEQFSLITKKCFEHNDAVLPLDQRLSQTAKENLVKLFRPHCIVSYPGKKNPFDSTGSTFPEHQSGNCSLRDTETINLADGVTMQEGDALVMPTSGTTGIPKGVVLTLEALQASAAATNEYLDVNTSSDKWLCCLPLGHIGGFSVMTRGILTSTPTVIIPKFETKTVLELIEREHVTLTSLVTTTLNMLGGNASLLRKILLGGSKAPENTPDNVVKTYGMTETASGVVYDGNILSGMEIAFRDPGNQLSAPDKTLPEGEICLRGKMLFRNYRLAAEDPKINGWFPTGDAGRLNKEGRLEVDGRIAEMIITGGENVWPSQVENIISKAKNVSEVVVAGLDDEKWGQKVVAFIVPIDRGAILETAKINETIKETIGPWAVPKDFYLMNEIPKTAIGKPIKSQLLKEMHHAELPAKF